MIILIISSTAAGLALCEKLKTKILICRELSSLCDSLLLDLEYRVTPARELLEKLLSSGKATHLSFISSDCLSAKRDILSPLSRSENEEISLFFYSLGKSDISSQKKLILSFREYINKAETAYSEKYKKDSKLYVSFGLFFGIVFSLIWS